MKEQSSNTQSNSKLRAWIEIQELPKHIAPVFRIILGGVLAWYVTGNFDWAIFFLTLLSVFFIADGAFISNEYFDYATDSTNFARLGGDSQSVTSTGGTRVLVKGLIKQKHALVASIVFFLLAMPIGIILQFGFGTGVWTIPLGAIGILIGWFYTAPPIKAAYRGFGEIFMAFSYFLLVITIYYTQAGLSWFPVVVASTQLFAVPAIKILREFPDYEADKNAGKRTLVVIFGKEKMSIVYVIMMVVAVILFAPTFIISKSLFALLNFIPVYYILRSAIEVARGNWRNPQGLAFSCRYGFYGLMFSPLAISLTFLLNGLFGI
jgi:1,4-dihydroxy-2-naphthoate octaprenyltransferase